MDKDDEGKVYLVAEPEIKGKAEKLKIPPLKSGFIKGFAGAILNKTMASKVDGFSFLVGTRPDLPDPGGATTRTAWIGGFLGIDSFNLEIYFKVLIRPGDATIIFPNINESPIVLIV